MTARTDATKRKLYSAAMELMGARGVDETSVDEVVERAGVAKATVYYHFTSKADLVEAAIGHYSGMLTGRFREIAAACGGDEPQCIDELIAALLLFYTEEHDFLRLQTRELWSTDRPWHDVMAQMRHELVETFCGVVKHGVDRGVFRADVDPDFAGYAIFGLTAFSALDRLVNEPDRPFDDLLGQITSLVATSLRPT